MDRGSACSLIVRVPFNLGEPSPEWLQVEWHASTERATWGELGHRTEKAGEHEIVAEISRTVEVMPEMNPHADVVPWRGSEREYDFDMAVVVRHRRERFARDLPTVVEIDAQAIRDV